MKRGVKGSHASVGAFRREKETFKGRGGVTPQGRERWTHHGTQKIETSPIKGCSKKFGKKPPNNRKGTPEGWGGQSRESNVSQRV